MEATTTVAGTETIIFGETFYFVHVIFSQMLKNTRNIQVFFDWGAIQPHFTLFGQTLYFVAENVIKNTRLKELHKGYEKFKEILVKIASCDMLNQV